MAALMGANKQLLPGITATDNPSEAFVVRTSWYFPLDSFIFVAAATAVSRRVHGGRL